MHTYTYAHTCVRTRVCDCECVMALCTHARRDDFCVQRPQRRISSTMSSAGSCRTHNANANPKEGVYAELADNSSFCIPQRCPFAERFVSRFVAPSARPLFLRRNTLRSSRSKCALPTILSGFGESPWKALMATDTEELPSATAYQSGSAHAPRI